MDEFKDTDLVCVTRYCPHCGSEFFCRSDYERHRIFYISEDMTDPTNTCPRCQFNLLLLPVEAIVSGPDLGKKAMPRMITAGTQLIESLCSKSPEIFNSKASARRALKAVGETIFDVLSAGEDVRWRGFGSFKIRQRKPRKGRNPRTGEELQIPARKAITFSPSKRHLNKNLTPIQHLKLSDVERVTVNVSHASGIGQCRYNMDGEL